MALLERRAGVGMEMEMVMEMEMGMEMKMVWVMETAEQSIYGAEQQGDKYQKPN
jgi:hypothetical protein